MKIRIMEFSVENNSFQSLKFSECSNFSLYNLEIKVIFSIKNSALYFNLSELSFWKKILLFKVLVINKIREYFVDITLERIYFIIIIIIILIFNISYNTFTRYDQLL